MTCRRTNAVFFSIIWVHSIGRANSENHRTWTILLPENEKFNVTDLSLLGEFYWNNCAHVILTAEADSLSTDAKQLLEDCGLVGCQSNRGNYLSVHARTDSTGYVRLLWESSEEEDNHSHAAIFDAIFGKKAEGSITDSREVTADTLFSDLESVASVVEGVPTANCLRDTKEKQLVTRSGLQRLRCCVCHVHHERPMMRLVLFESSSKRYFNKWTTFWSMSLLEIPMRRHTSTSESRSTKILADHLANGWLGQ